jgi:hypothetical protein
MLRFVDLQEQSGAHGVRGVGIRGTQMAQKEKD